MGEALRSLMEPSAEDSVKECVIDIARGTVQKGVSLPDWIVLVLTEVLENTAHGDNLRIKAITTLGKIAKVDRRLSKKSLTALKESS